MTWEDVDSYGCWMDEIRLKRARLLEERRMSDKLIDDAASLARCPFCGSDDLTIQDLSIGAAMAWVRCLGCRSSGPLRETPAEAVAAWNERAKP